MEDVRIGLARNVKRHLADNQMTQTQAAYVMRDAPSQVSLVTTGKLRGFSTQRLLRMNAKLGYDVDIRVVRSKRKEGRVRLITR